MSAKTKNTCWAVGSVATILFALVMMNTQNSCKAQSSKICYGRTWIQGYQDAKCDNKTDKELFFVGEVFATQFPDPTQVIYMQMIHIDPKTNVITLVAGRCLSGPSPLTQPTLQQTSFTLPCDGLPKILALAPPAKFYTLHRAVVTFSECNVTSAKIKATSIP